ncbi:acetyltransferase (GNAT) family protein [Aminobacter aminovorans]|uniref:Predicted acetyltransferase n=1 Tax=Aminobacter aminovorans TaxID=83263 RepID=A0A380WD38_AMIAI|nr:GNAT family N-acetyltransferase [Aminobacter aminovorans]TCS25257.1 acetyltransferase (GNAT) family protein [Aminobacter aminovorans]SUU86907.1 Predicted acetyltransferase [Aminobacter aminovorans]
MATHKTYSISDLRDRPEFAGDVAVRIWNAWWRQDGHELAFIRGLVDENFASTGLPQALVAHDRDTFLGTAHLIESDLEARPQYSPWVAAVWVDEAARKSGIGAALVQAGAEAAFLQGFDTAYLCAKPAVSAFYERLGWQRIEEDVEGLNVFSLKRKA